MKKELPIWVLFFLSGLTGLIYEIVWMRHLSVAFGCTIYATSTVLVGFMGGLAIGSYILGRRADRVSNPLRLYAIIEIIIGLFALAFPAVLGAASRVFAELTVGTSASFHTTRLLHALMIILILIIPTALMGGTLPLLTRHLTSSWRRVGRKLSVLYGLNTLGAVAGCALAGFVLIGTFGVKKTTLIAVALNLAIGLVAWLLSMHPQFEPAGVDSEEVEAEAPVPVPRWLPRLLLVSFGIIGVTAMAYEVLWVRVLVFFIGNTSYAFTSVLTTYLAGLAIGSTVIARRVDRIAQPLRLLGIVEILIGVGVLIALLFTPILLSRIANMLFEGDTLKHSHLFSFVLMQASTAMAFVFPFTFLMGIAFPVMARLYSRATLSVGSGAGTAYFADTIGAIVGALGAGFVLIPLLGTLHSIMLMTFVNMAVGVVVLSIEGKQLHESVFSVKRFAGLSAMFLALFSFFALGIPKDTFIRVFTAPDSELIYINEDVGGTVTIEQYDGYKTISINGVNVAGTDLKFETTQKLQAHLTMLLHPDPKSVLQIGFGSGGTAWALTRHPVPRIDCVEITQAIIKANDQMSEVNHGVLKNERVTVIIDDARSYLINYDGTYDVILSDSIHPRRSGNGGLYSVDYFKVCRSRLSSEGIFSAWLPQYGLSQQDYLVTVRSLKAVFPHVYVFHSPVGRNEWAIILGMLKPLKVDVAAFTGRMHVTNVKADLQRILVETEADLLSCLVLGDEKIGAFLGDSDLLNTDDFPYLEYVAPRSGIVSSRESLMIPVYAEMVAHREHIAGYLQDVPEDAQARLATAMRASDLMIAGRLIELKDGVGVVPALKMFQLAVAVDPNNKIARDLLFNK